MAVGAEPEPGIEPVAGAGGGVVVPVGFIPGTCPVGLPPFFIIWAA